MKLSKILEGKGKDVFSISPQATLQDVVQSLVDNNCGSLVVVQDEKMVGIITERDILRATAKYSAKAVDQLVKDTMTPNPITASPDHDVPSVMGIMTDNRIRHLPILENEKIVGIVSIGDIVKAQDQQLSMENHYLKNYIQS